MPSRTKKRIIILVIVSTIFSAVALAFYFNTNNRNNRSTSIVEDNRFLLDTVVTIRLYGSDHTDLLDEAFEMIDRYEKTLSRHHYGSDTSDVNNSETGRPVAVSPEMIDVLDAALGYAGLTDGLFDPTVGPLVDLWGIGGDTPRIPEQTEIDEALELVDYRSVGIDTSSNTVTLNRNGMDLDLGGIAKGWIADRIASFLLENGERHILLNLGGNVLVSGGKPGGDPFRIGMQDPFDERGHYLGVFSITDGSVVSSGIYERYFESDGVRYHHILDTANGRPVNNGLAGVTVLTPVSVDGDALSTALFVLGLEKGLALIRTLDDVEAAFVLADGHVVMTSGAAAIYESSDQNMSIEVRD